MQELSEVIAALITLGVLANATVAPDVPRPATEQAPQVTPLADATCNYHWVVNERGFHLTIDGGQLCLENLFVNGLRLVAPPKFGD